MSTNNPDFLRLDLRDAKSREALRTFTQEYRGKRGGVEAFQRHGFGPSSAWELLETIDALVADLHNARMGLWMCAREAGADLDGDETYKALKYPSVEQFALDAVRHLRDDCVNEAEDYDSLVAERDRLTQWKARIIGEYGEYHALLVERDRYHIALDTILRGPFDSSRAKHDCVAVAAAALLPQEDHDVEA
jgi:hypothetical protein